MPEQDAHTPSFESLYAEPRRMARREMYEGAFMQAAQSQARVPEQSAHVGRAWALLGDVQQRQGLQREAAASWQRALPIVVAALGTQHPQTLELQALLAARP